MDPETPTLTEFSRESGDSLSPYSLPESDAVTQDNEQAEEHEKATLLAYISDVEQKTAAKNKLREKNQAPQRLDESALAKLDSSLKKNTAFVRKLRSFTAAQLDGLVKDMSSLNLSKYISEVASAIVEVKLKLSDVFSAVTLCSELNMIYSEFSKVLLDHWTKSLSLKKDEKIANPSKLRVDLRFYGDLITSGIFPYKDALPFLGNILTVLTTSDKDEHTNINIILSFCKHCGEEYAGLVPRSIRTLSAKYNIPVPRSSLLPPEKQKNVRSLLKDYYSSLCKHLIKENCEFQAFERQNRKILQTKGELSAERKERGENLTASFQKLYMGTMSFAEVLDEDVPQLPDEKGSKTLGDAVTFDTEEGSVSANIWEDEETQLFYTVFPNLNEFLPNYNIIKPEKKSDLTMTEEKLDEDLKEDELDLEEEKKEEPVVEEIDESDSNTSLGGKVLLDTFLTILPNCVNKEMIDSAAIEFVMTHNTKSHRKKLVKTLFAVPRTRLDLLPFYARFVAILNPLLPDISSDLNSLLKQDFKYHIRKKDQINIESKLKVIRFISELVKFSLYQKLDGLYCLKVLLHDFSHHHIEMACAMLEACGRYFLRSPDTYHRTKVYLDQMMRMKTGKALESRYVMMIENAYYYVSPPDMPVIRVRERPPMHEFIRHCIYERLTRPSDAPTVLGLMRKLNWSDPTICNYAIKSLTQAWNLPYPKIKDLANLLAGLVDYQEFVAAHVVDGVLEDIRIGLEINTTNLNQRRMAIIKYLGELYNYRMVESNDVFKVLYLLISFGVGPDHENSSRLDPPDQLFRVRLVCTLLETCGQYFSHGPSKIKLDYFCTYFQHYYWYKHSDPTWTTTNPFPTPIEHLFKDTLKVLRPQIKLSESFEEAKEAYEQVIIKIKSKYGPLTSSELDNTSVELKMKTNNDLSTVEEYPQGLSEEHQELQDEEDLRCDITDDYSEDDRREEQEDAVLSNHTLVDRDIEETRGDHDNNMIWLDEELKDLDSDNDFFDMQETRCISPDDQDFLLELDRMVTENLQDRLRDSVKPQQVDIPIPLHHTKTNTKKSYDQLQEPDDKDKETINFVVMLRKGNKQQYKNVLVPTDSDLALNLRSQEKAERDEMEKVKRLTLDINDRLEEEDFQDQLAQTQKHQQVNLNRERRLKYQHPKGAPDADLIFGRKKIQKYL